MKEELMNIVKKDRKKLFFLLLLAAAAIFLMVIGSGKNSDEPSDASIGAEYSEIAIKDDIEEELELLLSSVDGAGSVDVVIYWDGTGTDHFAYNEEVKESLSEDGSSDRTEHREMVLLDGDGAPVLISHENAVINGVLIVAEGAADDRVRCSLSDAVSSCLGIGEHRIEVKPKEVR